MKKAPLSEHLTTVVRCGRAGGQVSIYSVGVRISPQLSRGEAAWGSEGTRGIMFFDLENDSDLRVQCISKDASQVKIRHFQDSAGGPLAVLFQGETVVFVNRA